MHFLKMAILEKHLYESQSLCSEKEADLLNFHDDWTNFGGFVCGAKRFVFLPSKNSCIIFTFLLGFVHSVYKIISRTIDVFYCLIPRFTPIIVFQETCSWLSQKNVRFLSARHQTVCRDLALSLDLFPYYHWLSFTLVFFLSTFTSTITFSISISFQPGIGTVLRTCLS